ncbi:sensor histidine kinase [Pseudomarimonas salicorniae]|uniref:histidine kinase n=1 Tax=Pseudomarimonas salicorniae TaxID=2933270 RepID=A0ABT0GHZ7_9GAMM|nr:HAMP domain-containing sensor histidine kinase [Lysobacter sp. CAU 1642]MCK7594169.1 HAMP domain-containing histidine kinase [Lysobacter sp. CAU 1642]
MKARSLSRLLGLQWAGFVLVLLLGFGLVAATALYVLEDSFIDQRLLDAEAALARGVAPSPPVQRLRTEDLPAALQPGLESLPPRALREYRLEDGRYLHLRSLPAEAGEARFLVIDAGDELRVGEKLRRIAPSVLVLLGLILMLAAWLARRFVRRIERGLSGLLDAIEGEGDVAALRRLATEQPVQEFRRFGLALADSLQQRLEAVERERETLRFLAHELRTPLQGARLALASLTDTGSAPGSYLRLQRSLQRLDRASAAVLWLGEQTPVTEPVEIGSAARALCDELAPLAGQRGQSLHCEVAAPLHWSLPLAAVEAVLGNLLLNAIQHGAPGQVSVQLGRNSLRVENSWDEGNDRPGFGLGLELSKRLLSRIGWTLDCDAEGTRFRVHAAPVASSVD